MNAGRNDPCPCGSGKKFKKCCLLAQSAREVGDLTYRRLRNVEASLIPRLFRHAEEAFGRESIDEAWDEFTCWQKDEEFSEESPFVPLFMPFYFFNCELDFEESDDDKPGKTIAESFLEINRKRLSKDEITVLESSSRRVFSFYELDEVSPSSGFKAKNVLTGEQHEVVEETASEMLKPGDIIFCALFKLNDQWQSLAMGPLPLPPQALQPIIEMRKDLQKALKVTTLSEKQISEYDMELRQFYFGYLMSLVDPKKPELQNTDGDPLLPQILHFEISSPDIAFAALKSLAGDFSTETELLNAAVFEEGKLLKIEIPWIKPSKSKSRSLSNTVLGRIKISGRKMTVEVNSDKRAKTVAKKIEAALGPDARFVTKVIESIESNIANNSQMRPSSMAMDNLPPEALHAIQAMADEHWKNWFTEKIPALNNMTPKQAAKTKEGRELLEALFNIYGRSDEAEKAAVNLFRPDVAKLRAQLGLK